MRIERLIGNQIKLLRAVHGMSLSAFAEIVGITPNRLQDIEDGWERASADLLVDIATRMGVEPSYFFRLVLAHTHKLRT
jgi:transcriptional regulator with XRE-family HTH domain